MNINNIETAVKRTPIDYANLRKGDVISAESIERLTGVLRVNAKDYAFALMNARALIEREMEAHGTPVICKTENQTIRVLTDAEAVAYSAQRHKQLTTAMRRSHVKSVAAIDPRQLSTEQLRRHERDVICRSRELQAARDARKQFAIAEQQPAKQLPE